MNIYRNDRDGKLYYLHQAVAGYTGRGPIYMTDIRTNECKRIPYNNLKRFKLAYTR